MKYLAIIAALLCALTLAACGPSIEEANKSAKAFCTGHGGGAEVEYFDGEWPTSSNFDVHCRDGSEIE